MCVHTYACIYVRGKERDKGNEMARTLKYIVNEFTLNKLDVQFS